MAPPNGFSRPHSALIADLRARFANLIVWPTIFERFRKAVLGASLLGVSGRVQREGLVVHRLAEEVHDLTALHDGLDGAPQTTDHLAIASRDFH